MLLVKLIILQAKYKVGEEMKITCYYFVVLLIVIRSQCQQINGMDNRQTATTYIHTLDAYRYIIEYQFTKIVIV